MRLGIRVDVFEICPNAVSFASPPVSSNENLDVLDDEKLTDEELDTLTNAVDPDAPDEAEANVDAPEAWAFECELVVAELEADSPVAPESAEEELCVDDTDVEAPDVEELYAQTAFARAKNIPTRRRTICPEAVSKVVRAQEERPAVMLPDNSAKHMFLSADQYLKR